LPLEIGLWRVDGTSSVPLAASGMPLESRLEHHIEADPTILGEPLLLIGRQVPTAYGTFIDLLAIDGDGGLHVLELKRDRTPREVVAQALDYGSWVAGLSHDQVIRIFTDYRPGSVFEKIFADRFGIARPEELNTTQRLTVVGSAVDGTTERIITYLNNGFGVPINVVFFRYYADGEREYLARSWLLDASTDPPRTLRSPRGAGREDWNGQDWYVSFGEESGVRNWDDARRYGFVSAGGGQWFSRTLRALPLQARVFVCIPKIGYVGVGTVTGTAQRFTDTVLTVEGAQRRLDELQLHGRYRHGEEEDQTAEYVIPYRMDQDRAPRPGSLATRHVRQPEQCLQTSQQVHPRRSGHHVRSRPGPACPMKPHCNTATAGAAAVTRIGTDQQGFASPTVTSATSVLVRALGAANVPAARPRAAAGSPPAANRARADGRA